MASTLLTIGIPTFNRSEDLDALLQSIRRELQGVAPEVVHVMVSDNNSDDRTAAVVEEHQRHRLHIGYSRNGENIGMQMNFWNCITSCDSEYLWLIGDDEAIEPGGLASVLQSITENPLPVLVFNYVNNWDPGQLALQSVYGDRSGKTGGFCFPPWVAMDIGQPGHGRRARRRPPRTEPRAA